LAVGTVHFYLSGGRWVSTDDAYIKADIIGVATDVSGIVAEVAVHNNQMVEKGDILFRLNDEPYRLALAGAEAQVANKFDTLRSLKEFYRSRLVQVETAKTDVAYYQRTNQRQTDLALRQATSQATLDQSRHDYETAQQRLSAAELQANAMLINLGGSADQPVEDNPQYRQAKSQLDKASRELRQTVVRAAISGIVANVDNLRPGNFLASSQTAFNLVGSDNVWIEAHLKETDLTYLQVGNPTRITVDAYPDVEWKAEVESISPATGSQFSVLPAQNSSGNWVKVVQRVPVRLRIEKQERAQVLRAGMSVAVEIDTGHKRSLAGLVEGMKRAVGL
jgi:membrane fusion protein (multidrug efflux system)